MTFRRRLVAKQEMTQNWDCKTEGLSIVSHCVSSEFSVSSIFIQVSRKSEGSKQCL